MADRMTFERERLRYCEAMYSLEKERKQIIERHAQFYFGVITLFLGLLALKAEVISAIRAVLAQEGSRLVPSLVYLEMSFFMAALVSSLISIGMVFAPERRQKPYPKHLVTQLFSGERWEKGTEPEVSAKLEADLLRENAMRFAIAVERNSVFNTKKSKWLLVAAVACFATIVFYAFLAVTVVAGSL